MKKSPLQIESSHGNLFQQHLNSCLLRIYNNNTLPEYFACLGKSIGKTRSGTPTLGPFLSFFLSHLHTAIPFTICHACLPLAFSILKYTYVKQYLFCCTRKCKINALKPHEFMRMPLLRAHSCALPRQELKCYAQ